MNLELLLVAAVVAVRLVAPLAILRYPLPGLVFSAFVIDSVDRDAYHAYLDITEMQYQRFDKALDPYSLCFAYLAMLRHWKSPTAVTIGRALFFYRLIGVAVFELTGVESSARSEAGRLVIELNAKFQCEPGAHASPMVLHQLTLIGQGMPGVRVTAEAELEAARAQHRACERLTFREEPPRGCADVAELLALDAPLAALHAAGFPREGR